MNFGERNSSVSLRMLGLAALFSLYGPSFTLGGQFRYLEVVLVVLFFLGLKTAIRSLGSWEKRFVSLFLLTAFAQVISDLFNSADFDGTLKRSGTYLLLAIIIIALRLLSRADFRRIRWILAGYCLSYIFILFVGTQTSQGYSTEPWRLGLGTAFATFLCVMIAWIPRYGMAARLLMLGLAAFLFFQGSRSVGVLIATTGVFALWSQNKGNPNPSMFRVKSVLRFSALALILFMLSYFLIWWAANEYLLPAEIQTKMELQLSSPYGLLAAARPDTAAAIYAILKKPFLGYGSTGFDQDVWSFYIDVATSSYMGLTSYRGIYNNQFNREWGLGIPSHSHIFGAWVDAGFLAALCWLVVLWLAFYVITRVALWNDTRTPLFVLIALLTIWDVLFSPGPHRMDIAMKLMVLTYAAGLLKEFDLKRRARRRA